MNIICQNCISASEVSLAKIQPHNDTVTESVLLNLVYIYMLFNESCTFILPHTAILTIAKLTIFFLEFCIRWRFNIMLSSSLSLSLSTSLESPSVPTKETPLCKE